MTQTSERFLALDALRGVAAAAVFFRHVPDPTMADWLPGSYLAVDFFFLLSGFVLAHAYEPRIGAQLSAGRFMMARYVRLAPSYYVGLALGLLLPLYAVTQGASLLNIAPAIVLGALFLPVAPFFPPYSHGLFPFNAPAWSLFFELVANAIFAALLAIGVKRVWPIVVLGGLGVLISGVFRGSLDGGFMFAHAHMGFARVLFAFFAGVMLYRAWRARRPAFVAPLPVLVIVLLAMFALRGDGALRLAIDYFAVFVVFPAVVFFGAAAKPKALATATVALGAMSYPLYAIHAPLIQVLSRIAERASVDIAAFGALGSLALLVFCALTALAVDRLIDRPARGALARALLRPPASSPPQR
jgi:peptidoglycan/LPS O-acetylase OafA/YrhL